MDEALIVFLDRDGVINQDSPADFVKSWAEFRFLPGALEALRLLKQAGAKVVVVSNQSGINRGIYAAEDLEEIDRRFKAAVSDSGGDITASYYCPHRPDEGCACRKPGTGLIDRAARELNLDLERSRAYFVGDRQTDIATGRRAGLVTILVLSGHTLLAGDARDWPVPPDHTAPDLLGALNYIL